MTLLYRLLLALLGGLLAVAPTATVEVVVESDAPDREQPGSEKEPEVRSFRPIVLKGAGRRDVELKIESEEPDGGGPAADDADADGSAAAPALRATAPIDLARVRPDPAPRAADVRAGLLDLPPPSAPNG